MAKVDIDKTIEDLKRKLAEMGITITRQHGRLGEKKEDIEAEKIRERNNLASQVSRAKKRLAEKEQKLTTIPNAKEIDEFGITDVDIRRYKKCYVYENVLPEREYIKRMTGLTDIQIAELDRRVRENILTV